uniref:Retrovirus-related Pol polyprotein from transposon TNT 1-94 n=2 Tax=Cajanus cajan TaxID=3821 RepID=A0A151QYL4_CAJCA|nr:hypothetical protein KK1_043637 [Cajanus cajan]
MASDSGFVQPAIPCFDSHYDYWSMLMENFLRFKEYWSLMEICITKPADGTIMTEAQRKMLEDQKLKDLKINNYLFQTAILETILKKDTTKDIWDSMKTKYQGIARVKGAQLQAFRKELEILHMKEGDSVKDYFAQTLSVANNKMRIHGEKLEDVVVVEEILRSMTCKSDYVVCSIEELNDIDSLSINALQSSLLVHEQRMTCYVVDEQAFKITTHEGTISTGRGRGNFLVHSDICGPINPTSNGNKIMNMVRSMLVKKIFSKTFWCGKKKEYYEHDAKYVGEKKYSKDFL